MGNYEIARQEDAPRALTAVEFQGLAEVPPALEWFANIGNEKTRRAYQIDVQGFMDFAGIQRPEEFRLVTRAHVIAWRRELERRDLAPSTLRRKLSALSSLFGVCSRNGKNRTLSRRYSNCLIFRLRLTVGTRQHGNLKRNYRKCFRPIYTIPVWKSVPCAMLITGTTRSYVGTYHGAPTPVP